MRGRRENRPMEYQDMPHLETVDKTYGTPVQHLEGIKQHRKRIVFLNMNLLRKFYGVTILIMLCSTVVRADDKSHRYSPFETVVVWGSKIGPFRNSHETYSLERVPLCEVRDIPIRRRSLTLGEVLEGHALVESSRLVVEFGKQQEDKEVCTMMVSQPEAAVLVRGVVNFYARLKFCATM